MNASGSANTDEAPDPFAAAASTPMRDRVSTADRVMAVVAAVLLPLGLVMVFLGWYGASRTPYLFEQVPYLVSGGLLGLGLVVTGGFVLFGSWISRTAREQRALGLELLEAVRQVRDELARQPLTQASLPAPPAQRGRRGSRSPATGVDGSVLVATAHGSMLHRPDCAVVADRDDLHDVISTDAEDLQPCRLCDPLGAGEHARV